MSRWSAEQVIALAPDAASVAPGRKLAAPRGWPQLGCDDRAVWGLAQGSGSKPYQVAVDLSGPAYKCSCPSRKIPCKHALGLLLLWSAGDVQPGAPLAFAEEWLQARAGRAEKLAQVSAERASRPAGSEARAKRQAKREERIGAGMQELDRWLRDVVRQGLAAAQSRPMRFWDDAAARLVDAQAPGLGGRVRALGSTAHSGLPDWPARLLAQLGRLHLAVSAWSRADALPDELRASLRDVLGWPMPSEDVRRDGEHVSDTWIVLGVRVMEQDRLRARRTWLRGIGSDRPALVVQFTPPGGAFEGDFVVGTALEGALAFYPAAAALRALPAGALVQRDASAEQLPDGDGIGVALDDWAYTAPDEPVTRWMVRVARMLRDEDLDASPASAVEAARAAHALAAIRGRPLPGLPELDDAALAVLCGGSELPLALIARRLVVGEVLGAVPEGTPMVPLARDLADQQRAARMKPQASAETRELDLRKPLDLRRSRLLHRLALLGVPWGAPAQPASRSSGTFKEAWRLEWQPEFAVRLIEQGRYGTTVEQAATAGVLAVARQSTDLAALAPLIEGTLLAALPGAVDGLMRTFDARAANVADVASLMDALVPLARVRRYGSVRQDDVEAVAAVVDGLVARICVGLSAACATLDDDGARAMVTRIDAVHAALGTLDREDLRAAWLEALGGLAERAGLHGLVAGRACRLLHDAGALEGAEVRRRLGLALSRGGDPADGAAWLEGFLESSGLVLVHDPALLGVIDGWVAAVGADAFDALLPLLRRTFSTFAAGERRQIATLVRRGRGAATAVDEADLDRDRAEAVLPVLTLLLGGERDV